VSCFVRGCDDFVVRETTELMPPRIFKHPRFGKVQACQDHSIGLGLVVALYEAVKEAAPGVLVVRCVECGKRPCVCQEAGRPARREEVTR